MADPAPSPRPLLTSVARAADLLLLFTQDERDDLGVTDVAAALGLSKAVVHRTLVTLAAKGLVEADARTRRYRLGPGALALGVRYQGTLDVRTLAGPSLRALSAATGETATLSVRTGDERIYVDQVQPDREMQLTMAIGRRYPLHAGASSKAFLAFLPETERERYLERILAPLTDRTLTAPGALRRELAAIRAAGHARSVAERQSGAASVAAPLLDHDGRPVAVMSVCGPIERFAPQINAVADRLLEETTALSRRLGHPGSTLHRPEPPATS